jgi:hypothetical protein
MNRRVLTNERWKMKDEIERRKKFRKILLKKNFVSADVKHTRRKFCTLKAHKHKIFGFGIFIQSLYWEET